MVVCGVGAQDDLKYAAVSIDWVALVFIPKKLYIAPIKEMKCYKVSQKMSIKMREMRGEVGKETPKKEMNNPSFL